MCLFRRIEKMFPTVLATFADLWTIAFSALLYGP